MRSLTLLDALHTLRTRWWVLLAAAMVAALAAFAYTRAPFVEPRWRSSVWVQATGRFDYGNTLALERQLRPLAERVRQLSVMREVDRNLHLDIPAEKMLSLVKAEPVQDSNQVRIDVEDADERRAEQIAIEIANVYTQRHNASQQAELRQEQVLLSVLDRPSTATLVWPLTRIIVPAAAVLGVLAAAAVLLGLAYADDTMKTPADVDRVLGLPVLGLLPLAAAPPTRRKRADPAAARTRERGAVPAPVSAASPRP